MVDSPTDGLYKVMELLSLSKKGMLEGKSPDKSGNKAGKENRFRNGSACFHQAIQKVKEREEELPILLAGDRIVSQGPPEVRKDRE